MTKLTAEFNEATIRKGETFQIQLLEGGYNHWRWSLEIASGQVTLLSAPNSDRAEWCMMPVAEWLYRTEEKGDIEIVAREKRTGQTRAYKVHVI